MAYAHRIAPGKKVRLAEIDPEANGGLDKEEGIARTKLLAEELGELEDLLYFASVHGVLIVLQGMDTSGKDGAIRHMLGCMNVQSVSVAPFKVPTPEELAHDFLWRIHARTPGKGELVIFNRSHYEDVLVVRVRELVPEAVWRGRYEHINAFERLLAESGTIVLKFFLHISRDEQERRLLDREKDVEKSWKLNVGDWKERERWDDYQAAYEEALERCSTDVAPWHVVPANRKWFRDLAISQAVVDALREHAPSWRERLARIGDKAKAELATYRMGG
jgi:PPK2 family polyphosphate:nucleotide phosphotransferase